MLMDFEVPSHPTWTEVRKDSSRGLDEADAVYRVRGPRRMGWTAPFDTAFHWRSEGGELVVVMCWMCVEIWTQLGVHLLQAVLSHCR